MKGHNYIILILLNVARKWQKDYCLGDVVMWKGYHFSIELMQMAYLSFKNGIWKGKG